jgi:hypothetical protein
VNIMSFLSNHRHYWGIPHDRPSDHRLIQTCYECGAEREIKVNLRPLWIERDSRLEPPRNNAA